MHVFLTITRDATVPPHFFQNPHAHSGLVLRTQRAARLFCFQALGGLGLVLDGLLVRVGGLIAQPDLADKTNDVFVGLLLSFHAQQLQRPQRRLAGAVRTGCCAHFVLDLFEQCLVDLDFPQFGVFRFPTTRAWPAAKR